MTGPNKKTNSSTIDKINYGKSFNILKRANASRYLNAISHEDILKLRLNDLVDDSGIDYEKVLVMLSNVYQSISTRGLTTYEILEYFDSELKDLKLNNDNDNFEKFILGLVNYIAIFQVNYSDKYPNKFKYAQYFNYQPNAIVSDLYGSPPKNKNVDSNPFYNTSEFLNFDYKAKNKNNTKKNDQDQQANRASLINQDVENPTKKNPALSVILLNNKNLRVGTRNSIEISSFFNLISSLEYAKAFPYFNATFYLPSISKQDNKRVFKTATLNQFLFGGSAQEKSDNFNNFEGKIFNNEDKIGVKTNLSVFTSPQTAVNMNEITGHNENINIEDNKLRITTVHDPTRPFMTLKDFTIDVSPTKGLMSFKTGKISLVLHDRTRMPDIAPFIKPDLFGSFGAEIIVEYGWIHNESQASKNNSKDFSKNPIGDFLDSSRSLEKYMITNSQFTIENNGTVNINLSIAMKGPIDIRQTEIFADVIKQLDRNTLQVAIGEYRNAINELQTGQSSYTGYDFNGTDGNFTNLYAQKTIEDKQKKNIKRLIEQIKKTIKTAEKVAKAIGTDAISGNVQSRPQKFALQNLNIETKKINSFNKFFGYTGSFGLAANSITMISNGTGDRSKYRSDLRQVTNSLRTIVSIFKRYLNYNEKIEETKTDFVSSLIGGTEQHDMFFDNAMLRILKGTKKPLKNLKKYRNFKRVNYAAQEITRDIRDFKFDDINKDTHVSLGTIISSLIATHMLPTSKYDEVQIVFHTVNEYAGLASKYKSFFENSGKAAIDDYPLNIASLLIKREDLKKFLDKLFTERTRLTLESLISQIINNFVITKDNPVYGLSNLYTKEDFDSPVKPKSKRKISNSRLSKKNPVDRLNYIYYYNEKEDYDPDPMFLPPSIHLTFDTLTSREDEEKTICRITVYDRNDNPYQSIADIYNEIFLKRSRDFRKLRQIEQELNSKKITDSDRAKKTSAAHALIKNLIGKDGIFTKFTDSGGIERFRFKSGFGFDDLKEKYKKIVPSATFATQNTSLINASVATINEGKLNTVYITRADRNKTSELNNLVAIDMPLRILPAQASIEMFGCPWINFGQYIFLDFETGTTIDNTYAVTGVKHSMGPGRFTTQVTLSYGDVYGKYEGYADGFSRMVAKVGMPDLSDKKVEKPTIIKKQTAVKTTKNKNKKSILISQISLSELFFDKKEITILERRNERALQKHINYNDHDLLFSSNLLDISFENKNIINKNSFKRKVSRKVNNINDLLDNLIDYINAPQNDILDIARLSSKISNIIIKLGKNRSNAKNIYNDNKVLDIKLTNNSSKSNSTYQITNIKRRRNYNYIQINVESNTNIETIDIPIDCKIKINIDENSNFNKHYFKVLTYSYTQYKDKVKRDKFFDNVSLTKFLSSFCINFTIFNKESKVKRNVLVPFIINISNFHILDMKLNLTIDNTNNKINRTNKLSFLKSEKINSVVKFKNFNQENFSLKNNELVEEIELLPYYDFLNRLTEDYKTQNIIKNHYKIQIKNNTMFKLSDELSNNKHLNLLFGETIYIEVLQKYLFMSQSLSLPASDIYSKFILSNIKNLNVRIDSSLKIYKDSN